MEENNKKTKKDQQLTDAEMERLELLQRAHERKGKQLTISDESGTLKEIDELRKLVGKQLDSPQEKYNLY